MATFLNAIKKLKYSLLCRQTLLKSLKTILAYWICTIYQHGLHLHILDWPYSLVFCFEKVLPVEHTSSQAKKTPTSKSPRASNWTPNTPWPSWPTFTRQAAGDLSSTTRQTAGAFICGSLKATSYLSVLYTGMESSTNQLDHVLSR
jgi:hypothetical protein